MKLPTLRLAALTGLFAHSALGRVWYLATLRENPNDRNMWCLTLNLSDEVEGTTKWIVLSDNCNSFNYPGENQLAWDFPGMLPHYYVKVKAHHFWLIGGLGVTYGTYHGTFYFDIAPQSLGNGMFHAEGYAL